MESTPTSTSPTGPVASTGAGAGVGAGASPPAKTVTLADLGALSEHAARRVEDAKLEVRSDLKLHQWNKYGWAKKPEAVEPPGPGLMKRLPLIDATEMTTEEFSKRYGKPNLPVLLGGLVDTWKAPTRWSLTNLFRKFRHVKYRVGDDDAYLPVKLKMKYFLQYLLDNDDDSPLYIFDHQFPRDRVGAHMLNHYTIPPFLGDDLFLRVANLRPAHRWILIGPTRSGTGLHLDPLGTSAWNALISGHKRWVLMAPETPKEWVDAKTYMREGEDCEAIDYFNIILPRIREAHPDLEIFDFVQNPGETIFVPGGWWHAVLNLDHTVAVTQNFAAPDNWDIVWRSTRGDRPDMAAALLESMADDHPELVARALELNAMDGFGETEEMRKRAALAVERQRAQLLGPEDVSDDEEEFIATLRRGAPSSSSSSVAGSDYEYGSPDEDAPIV